MTKIFHFLQKNFGNHSRLPNILSGSIEDKCVDMRMFISSSMKAAIHLEPNYLVNLEVYKKKNFEEIQSLFNITQKWTIDMDEIRINSRSSGSVDKNKNTCLLRFRSCLGRMNDSTDATTTWEGQVEDFKMSPSYKELLGIDGGAIEFEWNIFPGFSSLQILQEFQKVLQRRDIELEKFTDRTIFMSMFHRNTTLPRQRADIKEVIAKLRETKEGAVSAGHAFLIPMFL